MLPYLCKWWFGWIIADWCSGKERHLEWSDVREHGLLIFSSNYLGFGCWMLHLDSLMNIILLSLYIYLLSVLFWFLVHSSPIFCSSLFVLYDKINIILPNDVIEVALVYKAFYFVTQSYKAKTKFYWIY